MGKSRVVWLALQSIVKELSDNELNVLEHYEQNNPNKEWDDARKRFREAYPMAEEE